MTTRTRSTAVAVDSISRSILVLRGQKVLLDSELAALYGVPTKRLNEQVRRNRARFPDDFLFELTSEELENLKPQNAISSWGGRRSRRFAFTEHGVIRAASILNSPRAVQMSIYVIRASVKLREALATDEEQAEKALRTNDKAVLAILNTIEQLRGAPQEGGPIGRLH